MKFSDVAPRGQIARIRLPHWAPGSYMLVPEDGPWGTALTPGLAPVQVSLAAEVFTAPVGEWEPYDGPLHDADPAVEICRLAADVLRQGPPIDPTP